MMNIILAETKLFLRKKSALYISLAYLLIAIVALFIGKQRLNSEVQAYQALQKIEQKDLDKWIEKESIDLGYMAYYLHRNTFLYPSPWSALFQGERLEKLNLQRTNLLSIHGQMHESPIQNHEHNIVGHLDLNFVFIYLLPLLIGSISIMTIVDEKKSGRWLFLNAISPINSVILLRYILRFIFISSINLIIIAIAFFSLDMTIDTTLLRVLFLIQAYTVICFIISAAISYLHLNSRQTMLTFTFVYLVLTCLLPSMHYISKQSSKSYNAGIEFLLNQRQIMNDSWDRDKKADFRQFLEDNPRWQDTADLGEKFDWKWYYAMQKSSDDQVRNKVQEYFAQRNDTKSIYSNLSPSLTIQNSFEDLAGSSTGDYQSYLQAIEKWHSMNQDYWFPYFFFKKDSQNKDFKDLPRFEFTQKNSPFYLDLIYLFSTLFISTLLFIFLYRKRHAWTYYKQE